MDAKKIEEVPFEEVYEVEKYGTYYSENKFWQKVQRVAKKVGATVIRPVFQLYYLLHDKDVPLQHKAYIIGALGYFILPFDLIPEGILPVIGFTDDVAVMGLVLKIVKDSITPEIRAKADASGSDRAAPKAPRHARRRCRRRTCSAPRSPGCPDR